MTRARLSGAGLPGVTWGMRPLSHGAGRLSMPGEQTQGSRESDGLDGRYIHRRDPEKNPTGTRTLTLAADGASQEWVHGDDFMDVQRERDDLRRAVALINAWRWSPTFVARDVRPLDAQLHAAGFDRDQGRAMLSIIASVQAERGAA